MNKIKLKRLDAGLTQAELCKMVKTSPKKLVAIERGDIGHTNLSLMMRIATALNSTVQELFLNEE